MKTNLLPKTVLVLGSLVAVGFLSPCRAQSIKTTVSTGFDYSYGKYGESTTTKVLFIPLTTRWDGDLWNVKLTVPYVRVSGPATVIPELGQVGLPPRPTAAAESGIGDIVLAGSYGVIRNTGFEGPSVDLTGRVKFGTSDFSKGLGTGETDYSTQLDCYQSFGRMTPFGSFGYRVMGDPPGFNLRNHFYTTIGANYRINQRTVVGALFDWRQKLLAGGDAGAELTGYVEHRMTDSWRLLAYGLAGFSNASPDGGLGLSLGHVF